MCPCTLVVFLVMQSFCVQSSFHIQCDRSSSTLESSSEHSSKLINAHPLTLYLTLRLVLSITGYLHFLTIDGPSTSSLHKLAQLITSQVQPYAQDRQVNLPECLADFSSYPYPDKILEASHIRVQICVEVVAIQRRPESVILRWF